MNSTHAAKGRDIFLTSGGLLLFAYIISRAFNVSLEADEAGSWQLFGSKCEIFPSEFGYFSANNHALNTALMALSEKFFGMSQFALRLPNVLAGALYIFSTAMIARRMPSALIACMAFLVMNTNPFMIQYFNVARGYGLAAGLMAFAFWQLWKYFDEKHALKNLLFATVAAVLAVFANYTYLNLFLPLAGFTGLFILFHRGEHKLTTRARFIHAAATGVLTIGVLAVVIPIGNKIKAAGGFWDSNLETFWEGSVGSVIDGILFNVTRDPAIIYKWVLFTGEVFFIAAIVTLGRYFITRKEGGSIFPVFILTVLTLSAVSVILQHEWLGLEYPVQRIGLFMVWPLLLLVSLAAGMSVKNTWITIAPIAAFTLLVTWHFVSTASAWSEAFHPASEQVHQTMQELRDELAEGQTLHIAADPVIISNGLDFYKTEFNWRNVEIIRCEDRFDYRLCQYCYASRDYVDNVTAPFWQPVKTFVNGNVLYKNTWQLGNPVAEHVILPLSDTVATINEKQNALRIQGLWPDSLGEQTRMMAEIEMEVNAGEDAEARLWACNYRNDQEVFAQFAELREFREGEWQKVKFEFAMPQLQRNDDLTATIYWGTGEFRVKNLTLTVKAY